MCMSYHSTSNILYISYNYIDEVQSAYESDDKEMVSDNSVGIEAEDMVMSL